MDAREKLINQLQIFGSKIIEGFGSEEQAAEKMEIFNGFLDKAPNVFKVITDQGNIDLFNEVKETIAQNGFGLSTLPVIMKAKDRLNLYNN